MGIHLDNLCHILISNPLPVILLDKSEYLFYIFYLPALIIQCASYIDEFPIFIHTCKYLQKIGLYPHSGCGRIPACFFWHLFIQPGQLSPNTVPCGNYQRKLHRFIEQGAYHLMLHTIIILKTKHLHIENYRTFLTPFLSVYSMNIPGTHKNQGRAFQTIFLHIDVNAKPTFFKKNNLRFFMPMQINDKFALFFIPIYRQREFYRSMHSLLFQISLVHTEALLPSSYFLYSNILAKSVHPLPTPAKTLWRSSCQFPERYSIQ